jgi:hypothetical protein
MVFTLEYKINSLQCLITARVKRNGEWTYSVQACKEEFLANYLDQNVLEKSLAVQIHRIVNRFVTTGNVENGNIQVVTR